MGTGTAAGLGGGASYSAGAGLGAPAYSVFGGTESSVGTAVAALQSRAPIQFSNASGMPTPLVPSQDVAVVGAGGGPVGLHNVAAGTAATDAVNVSQLTGAITQSGTPVQSGDTGPFGTNASGAGALAVGNAASAITGATALGSGAQATVQRSVALGSGSTTRPGVNVSGVSIAGAGYGFAGTDPAANGVLSAGAVGQERQVQNVAAGQLTASSTDGVNGSQLFATNTAVGVVSNQVMAAGMNLAQSLGGGSSYTGSGGLIGPRYGVFGSTQSSVGGAVMALQSAAPTQYASVRNAAPDVTSGRAMAVSATNSTPTPFTPSNDVMLVGAASGVVGLRNLAAGQVASGSTDGVNGSQLFALSSTVNTIAGGAGVKYVHVNASGADGGATGAEAVALGGGAMAAGAGSVVHGGAANDNGAAGSVVLGQGASIAAGVTGSNVALGQGSIVTAAAVQTSGAVISGQTYQFAGGVPGGVVSVGAAGNARVVTSVAAGALSSGSTDAVNGSQLYATNTAVNAITASASGGGLSYFHANSSAGITSLATGTNAVAVGSNSTAAGAGAIAQGMGSSASGDQSTALGANASVTVANSAALGAGSVAGRGAAAAYAAPGLMVMQQSAGEISVGQVGATRQLTNLAAGSQASDAVTVAQLQGVQAGGVRYDAGAGGPNFRAITLAGVGGTAITNVAPAELSATSTGATNGGQLFATNQAVAAINTGLAAGTVGAFRADNGSGNAPASAGAADAVAGGFGAFAAARGSVALGTGAVATGAGSLAVGSGAVAVSANSVAVGAGSVASRGAIAGYYGAGMAVRSSSAGEVSFGSIGSERQLTNVAPGIAGTDAVNVAQLGSFAAATDRRIRVLQADSRAGSALALASSQLRYDDKPGKLSIGFGTGVFQGTLGMALGLSKVTEDGRWKYNFSGSFSPTNTHAGGGFGAGITYTFN